MKYLLTLALSLLCTSVFAADGNQVIKTNKDVLIPAGVNGVDINRKWVAPSICRVTKSLTCVVCAEERSEGILVAMEVSSGAIGGYAVALDTGAIPSAGREPASTGTAGRQILSQRTCEYTVATTGLSGAACGYKELSTPRPFVNGLTLCASTADTEVTALFYTQRK